ncbi:hypothetical protein HYG89_06380 [Acinetobacter sp. SwsAc5]|uniref:hypothetical protein n=1 Tax=Acinetobacter sp. SwsAc5 TaxID=2749438 RepID=UPI0015BAA990|nr:hypothetical protein [Acinetobacter sp. SwsAc5]NWK52187.1 hypothetical protein [Acinetobacter sp. SwsAc5]
MSHIFNHLPNQIAAVRIGKDVTYAEIEAKRSSREQLERELEIYLADGGEVTVLEPGFTHFKNGLLPTLSARLVKSDEEKLAQEKTIEAKNIEIRKQRAALKEQRRQQSQLQHQLQIKEQCMVLSAFVAKYPRPNDFKRLAELCGYQVRHLRDAAKGHTRIGAKRWDSVKQAAKTYKVENEA